MYLVMLRTLQIPTCGLGAMLQILICRSTVPGSRAVQTRRRHAHCALATVRLATPFSIPSQTCLRPCVIACLVHSTHFILVLCIFKWLISEHDAVRVTAALMCRCEYLDDLVLHLATSVVRLPTRRYRILERQQTSRRCLWE